MFQIVRFVSVYQKDEDPKRYPKSNLTIEKTESQKNEDKSAARSKLFGDMTGW